MSLCKSFSILNHNTRNPLTLTNTPTDLTLTELVLRKSDCKHINKCIRTLFQHTALGPRLSRMVPREDQFRLFTYLYRFRYPVVPAKTKTKINARVALEFIRFICRQIIIQVALEIPFIQIEYINEGATREVTDRRFALTDRPTDQRRRDLNGDYVGWTIPTG